jgi:hypothetical protein
VLQRDRTFACRTCGRLSVPIDFLLARSGERAALTLTGSRAIAASLGDEDDAQLFAQPRTLRIRQSHSFDFSNSGVDLAVSGRCDLTSKPFSLDFAGRRP